MKNPYECQQKKLTHKNTGNVKSLTFDQKCNNSLNQVKCQ